MKKDDVRPFIYLTDPPGELKKKLSKLVHFTEAALDIIDTVYEAELDDMPIDPLLAQSIIDDAENSPFIIKDENGVRQVSQEEFFERLNELRERFQEMEDEDDLDIIFTADDEEDDEDFAGELMDELYDEMIIAKCLTYCKDVLDPDGEFLLDQDLTMHTEEPFVIGIVKKQKGKKSNG